MKNIRTLGMLFTVLCCTYFSQAQNYSFGGLLFTSSYGQTSGTAITLSDSVSIGFDAATQKNLLFIKGKVSFNAAVNTDSFKLTGPFTVYAQVGSGSPQVLWDYSGSNSFSISSAQLSDDNGGTALATTGSTVTISSVPFRVTRIYLGNKPVSALNNSYVSLNGNFEFPETDQSLQVTFSGSNKVTLDSNGISCPAFQSVPGSAFTLKKMSYTPGSLKVDYDASNNRFSLYGKSTFSVDSSAIPVNLGDSLNPGIIYDNGTLASLGFSASDSFNLFGTKMVVDNFTGSYSFSDSLYKLYGTLVLHIENSAFKVNIGNSSNPGLLARSNKILSVSASVTDSFHFQNLLFRTYGVTLLYDSSLGKTLKMFGSLTAVLNTDSAGVQDSVQVSLGDQSNPGFVIKDGTLTQFSMSSSQPFKLKKLEVIPASLTLAYNKTGKTFSLYGDATLVMESDSLLLSLGSSSAPGVVFSSGKLQSLNLGLTDTFSLRHMKLVPRGLTFTYDASTANRFMLYGNLTALFDGDTIYSSLGSSSNPGFVFQNGTLQQMNLGVTAAFSLKKIAFKAQSLTFHYDKSQAQYELFGGIDINVDGNNMNVGLGNDANPGIVLNKGILTRLNISLTDTFKVSGIIFNPQAVTFQYNKSTSSYSLFGTLQGIIKSDTFSLYAGDSASPGFVVSAGVLQDINLGITADFKLKDISFSPKNLTFNYSRSQKTFRMYGTVDAAFDGNTIDVVMGDATAPGLVVNAATNDLSQLNLSTTDTFKLYDLILEPVSFSFQYNSSKQYYVMFGSVQAILDQDTLLLNMGTSSAPGIEISKGQLLSMNLGITGTFKLYELELAPSGLTVTYNKSQKKYIVYGGLTATIESNTLAATLGDINSPGLVIKNSTVQSINLTVNGNFKIADFEFTPQDLTFVYDKTNSYYEMYGALLFKLEDEQLTGDLGNTNDPGLVIKKGKLSQMNISVNSDIKINGLEVETEDLGVKYSKTSGTEKFFIHGTVKFKELWSISATLGETSNPNSGLEILISNGKTKIKLDDFSVKASNVNLSGISFKTVEVDFTDTGNGYTIDAAADVLFPAGFEVAGDIAFAKSGKTVVLDKVNIAYTATGNSQGIEIPATGVSIVYMSGGVLRIVSGNTEYYQFTGSVGLDFGGQFSLDGKTVQMMHIEGSVTIDKYHMALTDKMTFAAYESSGNWHSLLGEGTIDMNLNWSNGTYSIDGDVDFPSDPYVTMKGEALYKSSGLLDAFITVGLVVPHDVPFIGGDHIGSADGALRYNHKDLNNSWAAGWLEVKYWLPFKAHHTEVGVKYNFGSRDVSTIGSGTVDDISNTLHDDGVHKTGGITTGNFLMNTTKFELDGQSYTALVRIICDDSIDLSSSTLAIYTPYGTQAFIRYIDRLDTSGAYEDMGTMSDLAGTMGDKVAYLFTAISQNSGDTTDPLPPGEYTVVLTKVQATVDSFSVKAEVMQSYSSPECTVSVNNTSTAIDPGDSLYLEVSNALYVINDTLQPMLHVYYDTDASGYDGYLYASYAVKPGVSNILRLAPFCDSVILRYDTTYQGSDTFITKVKTPVFRTNTSCYVYAVIEDGVNAPVRSAYTDEYRFLQQPTPSITALGVQQGSLVGDDSIRFRLSADFSGKNASQYKITAYYDMDSIGYNGTALASATAIRGDQLDSNGYWFVHDFDNLIQPESVYFYAELTDTVTGFIYRTDMSYGYLFGPNLLGTVVYGDAASTPAQGIHVALDRNADFVADHLDYHISTDNSGRYRLSEDQGTSISVILDLPSSWEAYNPAGSTQKIISLSTGTTSIDRFVVNYPSVTGRITGSDSSAQSGIRIYADINGNGIFDLGTDPYGITDSAGNYVLLNVFGTHINIMAGLTGTNFTTITFDNMVNTFDDETYQTINGIVQ